MRHVHVISKYRNVVMNMDTTYWGRHFGLMIIKDTFRNKILWHRFVRDESVSGYLDGIEWLRANRVQHIRYRLRRHARFVSGIENIPVTDVPVPYDTDCPKTSDGKAGFGSVR